MYDLALKGKVSLRVAFLNIRSNFCGSECPNRNVFLNIDAYNQTACIIGDLK